MRTAEFSKCREFLVVNKVANSILDIIYSKT